MNPHIVALIFARGGSKGVPRKNIRLLAGKPLIAYSIEIALASPWIDRVVVSTDDDEIAAVARHFGAEVPFARPAALAQDDSPEWLAWQHAVRFLQKNDPESLDAIICLPTTSPFRALEDVDRAIQRLLSTDADIVITVRHAERNPYFNMVRLDDEENAHLVIPPPETVTHRQAAPAVYDITTVAYAARPAFVLENTSMFDGKMKSVLVPTERALDIDTELDFRFAEFLIKSRQA